MVIGDAMGEVDINAFTKPTEGLEFIENKYSKSSTQTILFLDINMPGMDGWEFLEEYEKFSDDLKKQISIYMLSSSVDHRDKNKADAYKDVKGFISKPLTVETIILIAKKELQHAHY